MNFDQVAGKWKHFVGKVKEQWGYWTNHRLDQIAGNCVILVIRSKRNMGSQKKEGEKQVTDWEKLNS